LQPAVLLRIPFFLLAGAFYGFFVDRVRRGRLAAAAATQREQARTEFLSLITHDLKQPLWLAKESATLLYEELEEGSPQRARRTAGQLLVNLRRMESLATNFLDLGRIEEKGLGVFPQRACLNRIVRDIVDSYAPIFETKQLEGAVELGAGLPDTLIDPPQFERALSNLLDNAFKFSPQGGRIVCKTERSHNGVLLTVADNGPGIGVTQAASLFSRFQDGQDAPGRPSTGLGLYITGAIIAAHGGRISVDPEAPPGACFRIWLPAAAEESADVVELAPCSIQQRVA
jgi:signal transduction histidine kinase